MVSSNFDFTFKTVRSPGNIISWVILGNLKLLFSVRRRKSFYGLLKTRVHISLNYSLYRKLPNKSLGYHFVITRSAVLTNVQSRPVPTLISEFTKLKVFIFKQEGTTENRYESQETLIIE